MDMWLIVLNLVHNVGEYSYADLELERADLTRLVKSRKLNTIYGLNIANYINGWRSSSKMFVVVLVFMAITTHKGESPLKPHYHLPAVPMTYAEVFTKTTQWF